MTEGVAGYWYSRFVFERALALVYLIAFLCAANQFVPLLGERGLMPISRFVRVVPFYSSPSLFYAYTGDAAVRAAAWIGVALASLALTNYPQQWGTMFSAGVWAALWILYLSFVNVGQTFYGFGWESLLLETGFLAMFLGGSATPPAAPSIWLYRWVLFRVMFGAGMIKLRGDPCWRDLTCLNYYFETQPIPNPLSWYFHWLPHGIHRAGVVFNHISELAVPFLYFTPQPFAAVGGLLTIAFQSVLILSGNLSWLNWITVVLCIPTLDDRWWAWLPLGPPAVMVQSVAHRMVVFGLTLVVALLSIGPTLNILSAGQLMNYSFNPIHLVNTYGAFGSITRVRNEIVIEGTQDAVVTDKSEWREYEFKGKPGDLSKRPAQIAPYHLRLDWLMWFAAMSTPDEYPWFTALLAKILQGDRDTLGLLRTNPFPDAPPRWVHAVYYEYRFTTPAEYRQTGQWWKRRAIGEFMPPVALRRPK